MNRTRALRWVLGTLGELLITLGLLLLLFVAWQLWWTDLTANRQHANTIAALERGFDAEGRLDHAAGRGVGAGSGPVAVLRSVPFGQAFAVVRIPRFGADYARPVLEGTDVDTLTKGLGHYTDTAMPGLVGNFAVAGHRTTYGRPFHNIDLLQKGDLIVVETKASYIIYAVNNHVIVSPERVDVVAPVAQQPGTAPTQAWMTLTACHPKYSANERYVVFAKLVTRIPRADGLPASVMALKAKVA